MAFVVVCSHCRKRIRVQPEYAGRRVKCPACQGAFQIPVPQPKQTCGEQVTPQPQTAADVPSAQSQSAAMSPAAGPLFENEPDLDDLLPPDLPPETATPAADAPKRPLRGREAMPRSRSKSRISLNVRFGGVERVGVIALGIAVVDFAFMMLAALAAPRMVVGWGNAVIYVHFVGAIPLIFASIFMVSETALAEGNKTKALLCRKMPIVAVGYMLTGLPKTFGSLTLFFSGVLGIVAGAVSLQLAKMM